MLDCKYCGENTQNKNAICNNCKNKLNAKKYLKAVLVNFKPDEVFSKRNLGLYLDSSLNVDIVLLTLNDYGMVVRRGGHGYKLATKEAIDEFLSQEDLTLIKSKKTKKRSYKSKSKKIPKYTQTKLEISNDKPSKIKKCKICGADLPPNSKNDICRKCSKKSHAVQVLEEVIPITGVGIPFKKEDLNNIYKDNPIKANDTIWSLQDFNLIKAVDSNTYELVSESELNKFLKENNSSNNVSELLAKGSENALQKTCLRCKKTLPISEFRKISEDKYSDYCKSCDKIIKTVDYLIEFVDTVKFDEFKIEDIKNIENAQGKIFNLQDNDLITFNGQYYKLVDEEKVYSFINHNMDDDSHLEKIIEAFKTHETMIQAAKSVNVSNVDVTNFYIEGKNGNPKYVKFFNDINKVKREKLENSPCPKCKKKMGYSNAKCNGCGYVNIKLLSLDEKMDFVLAHIRENNSVKSAKELDIPYENVKKWDKLGKSGILPYTKFHDGIIQIKNESKDISIKRNKISKLNKELNEKLREIQKTELKLDININKLKSIDTQYEELNIEYNEISNELNSMKSDLNHSKEEIHKIKNNLSNYSLEELDNIQLFDIKNTKGISRKVNNLVKRNDLYFNSLTIKNEKINKLENQLSEIHSAIDNDNENISKLAREYFVEPLIEDKNYLMNYLNNSLSKLIKDSDNIKKHIINLKNNDIELHIDEFKVIDYSSNVNDLISKNRKLTIKQMNRIIDNLDDEKELKEICDELNVSSKDVSMWINFGKSNKTNYIKFYEKIKQHDINRKKLKSSKIKLIDKLNNKLEEINNDITDANSLVYKLSNNSFIFSLKSEVDSLKNEINKYIVKLNSNRDIIEKNIKYLEDNGKISNFDEIDFEFIDYSAKVDELISKNEKMRIDSMKLIIENLDESKELKTIITDLNISLMDAKLWYHLGKLGNDDYVEFYEKIHNFNINKEKLNANVSHGVSENKEKLNENVSHGVSENKEIKYKKPSPGVLNKLVKRFDDDSTLDESKKSEKEAQKELFLKYYEETKDFKKAANLANIQLFLAKFWYNSGKRGDEQFIEFYNRVNRIKKP